MLTDTQTPPSRQMRAAQSRNGSEHKLATLDDIVPEDGTHPVAAARILKIRREVLHATFNIRKNEATRLRHEATIEHCAFRLIEEDDKLASWAKRDLRGRIEEAKARAELCIETKKQYEMEIGLLVRSLQDRPNTFTVRLRRWLSLTLWT